MWSFAFWIYQNYYKLICRSETPGGTIIFEEHETDSSVEVLKWELKTYNALGSKSLNNSNNNNNNNSLYSTYNCKQKKPSRIWFDPLNICWRLAR